MPILAAVPLLALAAALRHRRIAFHWWALPVALFLHAWMWTGAARTPGFLAAFFGFLALVGLAALRGRPAPLARAAGEGAPPLAARAPSAGPDPVVPAAADPARRAPGAGPEAPAVPERGTPPPPPDDPLPDGPLPDGPLPNDPAPVAPPAPRASRPAVAAPTAPSREARLLAALEERASASQREALWPQLEREGAGLVAAEGPTPTLLPGEGRWGGVLTGGVRLEWDFLATPATASVLVISCEDPGRGPATVLVPTDRPGVKALGTTGGRTRWVGRGVFVPDDLVLRGR